MKKNTYIAICVLLAVATVLILVLFGHGRRDRQHSHEDGIEHIDPNTIELKGSGVRVSFSEVILSKPEEERKLVVMEREATVSTTIENDKLFDWEVFGKNQVVKYTARGCFVVELDSLTEEDIITDHKNRKLTIKIPHPKLDAIEIDPNRIVVGEQQKGLLAFGNLKMTVNDYVLLESELQKKLKTSLDTSANGQEADDIAIRMVREVYEPVVHAIDSDYSVNVEFK